MEIRKVFEKVIKKSSINKINRARIEGAFLLFLLGGALVYESKNTYDYESKISEQTREYSFGNDRAREVYSYVY